MAFDSIIKAAKGLIDGVSSAAKKTISAARSVKEAMPAVHSWAGKSASQMSTLGPSSCAEGCSCLLSDQVMRYQLIGSLCEVIETNAIPMNCFKHM